MPAAGMGVRVLEGAGEAELFSRGRRTRSGAGMIGPVPSDTAGVIQAPVPARASAIEEA